MQLINAISRAPAVSAWLENSRQPRILHVFDQVCNLINERREILSIVTSQIGNGPFHLVVEGDGLFSKRLGIQTHISLASNCISLGDLAIRTGDAQLWCPHPAWERLHDQKDSLLRQLLLLPNAKDHPLLP